MKLGSPDLITMYPLAKPMASAMSSDRATASQNVMPNSTAKMAANMPVVPVITPDDRSNSPPIISNATARAVSP